MVHFKIHYTKNLFANAFTGIVLCVTCFLPNTNIIYAAVAVGELHASMYAVPVPSPGGLGVTNLEWTSTGTSYTQLWVSENGAPKTLVASAGISGSAFAPWIQQGNTYTFYLHRAFGFLPGDTLVLFPGGYVNTLLDKIVVYGIAPVRPIVGLNKWDLHAQYYGVTSGCENDSTGRCVNVSKRLAKKSIQDAKYIGAGYMRIAVSDYYGDNWCTDSLKFWSSMDELVNDLNAANIKMVPCLMFNVYQFPAVLNSDMHTLITDPTSNVYKHTAAFITRFVNRYKNNRVVCFWELTNEMNLLVDIDEYGRSGHNPVFSNFSSAEMFTFNKRVTALIRSLDKTHMITSGYSMPRASASHLMSQPEWNNTTWTKDSQQEYTQYLLASHTYFDIVEIHAYNGDNDSDGQKDNERFGNTGLNNAGMVSLSKQIADDANKLLYVGEFSDIISKSLHDINCQYTQNVLTEVQNKSIPFSSPWIWEVYQANGTYKEDESDIDPIYTTPLVTKIKEVNAVLGNRMRVTIPDVLDPICIIAFPFTDDNFAVPYDTIYTKVSDNSLSIKRVELLIDGVRVASSRLWPYTFPINTDALPSGKHTVVARAYDRDGNNKSDAIILFKNSAPGARRTTEIPTDVSPRAENDSKSEVVIYPNPSNGNINIKTVHGGMADISVSNASGEIVFTKQIFLDSDTQELNLGKFSSGLYHVMIRQDASPIVKTIVIDDKK